MVQAFELRGKLIAYFLSYDKGRIENDDYNNSLQRERPYRDDK
jgi:hypothetical protein